MPLILFTSCTKNTEIKQHHVMLITLDATRADHLPCYGYERDTTPNICKLVDDGVLFKNAFSQSGHTPASVASMLTSKFPQAHGVVSHETKLPENIDTIHEFLLNRKYNIMFFSDYPCIGSNYHFPSTTGIIDKPNEVNKEIIEFIQKSEARNKSSFFWAHYRGGHFPYLPGEEFKDLYEQNLDVDLGFINKLYNGPTENNQNLFQAESRKRDISDDLQYLVNRYDETLNEYDSYVGNLISDLKTNGLYDATLIIISADHGEGFGEHKIYAEHSELYNEMIHVPLIIKFPSNQFAGNIISQQVRHVDIVPTILDVLGVKKGMPGHGTSLIPAIQGKDLQLTSYLRFKNSHAIKTEKHKFIYKPNEGSFLFDLIKDPEEKHNIVNKKKTEAEQLKKDLFRFLDSVEKTAPQQSMLDE